MPTSIAQARRAGAVPHPFWPARGDVDLAGDGVGADEIPAGVPGVAAGLDSGPLAGM
jgi:hypothetical protein